MPKIDDADNMVSTEIRTRLTELLEGGAVVSAALVCLDVINSDGVAETIVFWDGHSSISTTLGLAEVAAHMARSQMDEED